MKRAQKKENNQDMEYELSIMNNRQEERNKRVEKKSFSVVTQAEFRWPEREMEEGERGKDGNGKPFQVLWYQCHATQRNDRYSTHTCEVMVRRGRNDRDLTWRGESSETTQPPQWRPSFIYFTIVSIVRRRA